MGDQWTYEAAEGSRRGKISPQAKKFFDALTNAAIDSTTSREFGCPTATLDGWRNECYRISILDRDKPKSAVSLFNKHKRDLISANWVSGNESKAWIMPRAPRTLFVFAENVRMKLRRRLQPDLRVSNLRCLGFR